MKRSELRKQAQRARSGLSHLNDEASRMQNRIDELEAEVERLREELDETAHVVIEEALNFPHRAICRCDACRRVAQRMDDAGFCDHAKDPWWQPLPTPPKEEE